MQDDAKIVERRDLEEDFAFLDRGADELADIAGNQYAGKRRKNIRPRKLIFDKAQLCFGLTQFGAIEIHVRPLVLGERFAIFPIKLLHFAHRTGMIDLQIPIIERGEQLALFDDIPRAGMGLGDEPGKGHCGGTLHPPFQRSVGADAELGKRHEQEQQQYQSGNAKRLGKRTAWAEQGARAVHHMPPGATTEPAFLTQFECQQLRRQARHALREQQVAGGERRAVRIALQRDDAHRQSAIQHRHGRDRHQSAAGSQTDLLQRDETVAL